MASAQTEHKMACAFSQAAVVLRQSGMHQREPDVPARDANADPRHPSDTHETCIAADASYVSSEPSTSGRLNINDMPVELLSRSFEQLLPKDLLAATHVCGYWRRTALLYSSIWSTIVASERDVDLILAMLERSGNALLSITLRKAASRNEDFDIMDPSWRRRIYDEILQTEANYKRFFDALLSNMRRVRTLHITVYHTSDIERLKALLTCSAPELVHFSLDVTSCSYNERHGYMNLFAHAAPRLRYFSVRGMYLPYASLGPMEQLSYLELCGAGARLLDAAAMEYGVREIVLHTTQMGAVWGFCKRTRALFPPSLSFHETGTEYALRLLPAAASVEDVVHVDGHLRVVQCSTGYIRDIRGLRSQDTLPYVLQTVHFLTRLTVSDYAFLNGLATLLSIPNLTEVEIIMQPVREAEWSTKLFRVHRRLPKMPSLALLTLDALQELLPVQEELVRSREPRLGRIGASGTPMEISAQKLEQFVLRLDAPRPTLRLKGIAISEMTLDPEDPSYLALLESVGSIEYGV